MSAPRGTPSTYRGRTLSAVAKVELGDVIRGVWPFLVAQLFVLALLTIWPALVLVPARWLY